MRDVVDPTHVALLAAVFEVPRKIVDKGCGDAVVAPVSPVAMILSRTEVAAGGGCVVAQDL
jgi:hypothetical protein